jgi:hypothetical protein
LTPFLGTPERAKLGATYTPAPIVDAMVAWACAEAPKPGRVVDPGAGSGRFLIAAAQKFPDTELVAIEVDPLAALMLRANAAVHGFADRLTARELFVAGAELTSTRGLRRVIDLLAELDTFDIEERKAVQQFLAWAKRHGAHEGYIATHRRAWWSVGLRAPAPILCTYMARRAPAFVRNRIKARHINIAHGLYPREPLSDVTLTAVLAYLGRHVSTTGGRTYAGGLVKFEPKELERILLPRIEGIHGYLAESESASQAPDESGTGVRCGRGQEDRRGDSGLSFLPSTYFSSTLRSDIIRCVSET